MVSCRLSWKSATSAERTIEAGQANPAHHQAGTCAWTVGGGGGGAGGTPARVLLVSDDAAAINTAAVIRLRRIDIPEIETLDSVPTSGGERASVMLGRLRLNRQRYPIEQAAGPGFRRGQLPIVMQVSDQRGENN